MEKRVHVRKATGLAFHRYLLHFKWPLFGVIIVFSFVMFAQINLRSILLSDTYLDVLEILDPNVMYPIDVVKNKRINTSINYHFSRKDQLKLLDDANAAKRRHKVVLPWSEVQTSTKSYLILEYTKVFLKPRFCSHTSEQIFGKTCPYTNCKYTCNRTHDNDAQVLLMHKGDLDYRKLDTLKRNTEQIWLLWHDEANNRSPQLNRYKFNWTISYRTSAEASLGAYGITVAKTNPWSMEQFNTWADEQFQKRHNQAVWFVSNCGPQKRLARFRSLRRHYPVAAFGLCISANESISLNARVQSQRQCQRHSSCETDSLSKSKFYLAFESQSCTDYITEKFWRTLASGAIPIVSGPNRENYVRIAPPRSFIHVDDYASDEQLAAALQAIANDRNLYGKYHYWRRYYDIHHLAKDLDPYRFCELCYRLNTNRQRIWYESINEWFLDKC